MSEWTSVETPPDGYGPYDIWVACYASALRNPFGETGWRVVDAYYADGKWSHHYRGEMTEIGNRDAEVTHWMDQPKEPAALVEARIAAKRRELAELEQSAAPPPIAERAGME